jgi:hypothetical protein
MLKYKGSNIQREIATLFGKIINTGIRIAKMGNIYNDTNI